MDMQVQDLACTTESRLEARKRPKFSLGLAPKRRSRQGFSEGGGRGKKSQVLSVHGYAGAGLGVLYGIASEGARKAKILSGSRLSGARAPGLFGRAAEAQTFVLIWWHSACNPPACPGE